MRSFLPEIRASGGFWIRCSAVLLLLPLPWALGASLAALVHELSHILCILALGGEIWGIRLGFSGAQIRIGDLKPWQEFLGTLAGPAGSFLLLLFLRVAPRTALCALVQGAFNLIPLYPMDGGRALHCLLRMRSGKRI